MKRSEEEMHANLDAFCAPHFSELPFRRLGDLLDAPVLDGTHRFCPLVHPFLLYCEGERAFTIALPWLPRRPLMSASPCLQQYGFLFYLFLPSTKGATVLFDMAAPHVMPLLKKKD